MNEEFTGIVEPPNTHRIEFVNGTTSAVLCHDLRDEVEQRYVGERCVVHVRVPPQDDHFSMELAASIHAPVVEARSRCILGDGLAKPPAKITSGGRSNSL